MSSYFRGKAQHTCAGLLVCGAAVVIPLAATTSAAQSQSAPSVIMSTSVTAISLTGKAKVTAVVRPGSLASSGRTVTFVNATTHKTLGTSVLRTRSGTPCTPQARSCRATLSVSGHQLVLGANRILGLFNPHRLYSPSFRGHTWLYRGVAPTCRSIPPRVLQPVFTASPIAYAARSTVCRGTVRSGTGTDAVVASDSRAVMTKHTVIAFGSQTLPCSDPQAGDLLAYSISGSRPPGDIALRVVGRAATIAHREHPNGALCYESTIRFKTASGAAAKRLPNGYYYGLLPHCRDNDADDRFPVHSNGDDAQSHSAPCIEWQQYSVKHGQATWTTWFEPTTGDPRVAFH